jgi:hypothetical protein
MMSSYGRMKSLRRMDEAETRRVDREKSLLATTIFTTLVAIALGVLYATKKKSSCGTGRSCCDRVAKLEHQVESFRAALSACENQLGTETSDLMRGEKEKLPGGWKRIIKRLHNGIQRDLGPITPPETEARCELRGKLLELDLMTSPKQTFEYWSMKLP